MLSLLVWDGYLPDTHVYTNVYDQGSFQPVARLAWLRDDLPEVANDDIESIDREQDSSVIQVYYYHNDQLGTPNELTNSQGEVVWLADYQAWGNTAKVVWREQVIDQMQVSQDELQPIRFQGQHFDTETGLHYNRFRYYDPDVGMFTTRDPIGLMGGSNVFQYAPNPTGWIDPLGLNPATAALGCGLGAWGGPIGCGIGGGVGFGLGLLGIGVVASSISGDKPKVGSLDATSVAEFCSNCTATDTRSVAQAKAYAHIGMSPGTGNQKPWTDFNPPYGSKFKKGRVWADFMQRSYPQSFGEWSNKGHIEEHPFGHPDIPGGRNHDCPHFVAWRNDGSPPIEFPYKPGTL